jgi:UDP-4-amino-4,6-dideoxy-N-acetyl-beta-L-altrosamine N-acetyltransferase
MLKGERVTLRAIEREDIPRFLRWLNDPEVTRYLTIFMPLSREEEERWFEQQLGDRNRKVLAIETESGEHIGNISLEDIDWKNRRATLGIVIGEKERWGQGYGTDAIRTLLRFAFEELNLNRVQLDVFDFNERARRCYRRCGFREEGILRQAHYTEGRYHDVVRMAILRSDWESGE